jgi:hypothetical protein
MSRCLHQFVFSFISRFLFTSYLYHMNNRLNYYKKHRHCKSIKKNLLLHYKANPGDFCLVEQNVTTMWPTIQETKL